MNRTTLNSATSSDQTPTPGYLFEEIAKVTHDPVGNDRLVEYLIKRLDNPSPEVKYKVLNIVKQVCRKGNPSFRKSFQRDGANAVKNLLKFHGNPDPLRGDEPSRRVRDCAKEALDAIFDNSRDERRTADPRIQGFGSQEMSPPPPPPQMQHYAPTSFSASNGGGNRYEGMGNPNFEDYRRKEAMNQNKGYLERAAEVVKDQYDKYKSGVPISLPFSGVPPQTSSFSQPPPWAPSSMNPVNGYTFASNRNDAPNNRYTSSSSSYDPQVQHEQPPVSSYSVSSSHPMGTTTTTTRTRRPLPSTSTQPDSHEYELGLVDELTNAVGIKPQPPKEKLEAFCKACRSFSNPSVVVDHLNEKLESEEERVVRKALFVLERMLSEKAILDMYGDVLDGKIQVLESLFHSPNPLIKQQVERVWKLLYGDEEEEEVKPAVSTPPAKLQQQQQKQQPLPTKNLVELDMFQDLELKSDSVQAAPTRTPTTGFDFMASATATPPVSNNNNKLPLPQPQAVNLLDDDLFSLMVPAPQQLVVQQQQQQPQPRDLLGGKTTVPKVTTAGNKKTTTAAPDSFGFVQDALAAKRNF